jgi:hypothetical protein
MVTGNKKAHPLRMGFLNDFGVADGARTHDNRNHNPGLYQLSYSHREAEIITRSSGQKPALVENYEAVLAFGLLTRISTLNLERR